MLRKTIRTDGAPGPTGAYSQAIQVGPWVFLAGQVGRDPATGEMAPNEIETQTRRTLDNMKAVLEAAGSSIDSLVQVRVFLKTTEERKTFNEVYESYFAADPPARTTVANVGLSPGVLVEIEGIAFTQGHE